MTQHQLFNLLKSSDEEMTFPMSVEEANENVEVSYSIGGKKIKNEGTVSFTLRFVDIEDMVKFRDDLLPKAGIRQSKGEGDRLIASDREFIAHFSQSTLDLILK